MAFVVLFIGMKWKFTLKFISLILLWIVYLQWNNLVTYDMPFLSFPPFKPRHFLLLPSIQQPTIRVLALYFVFFNHLFCSDLHQNTEKRAVAICITSHLMSSFLYYGGKKSYGFGMGGKSSSHVLIVVFTCHLQTDATINSSKWPLKTLSSSFNYDKANTYTNTHFMYC